jgi:hypothetical protein
MGSPAKEGIEVEIRHWLRINKKENSRLEFKQRIDLSTAGAKAEFIRDVIALANSEGESPREHGHLVVGFRNGRWFDIRGEHYDGATFGQILDAYIFPAVGTLYEELSVGKRQCVGVLVVKPDPNVLYVVRRRLLDDHGKAELVPGQSWGRKSDRKVELDGEAIHARLRDVIKRKIENATRPLQETINRLEREGGPALEVKKIRFEMEATPELAALEGHLLRLLPFAREFSHLVKHEILDAVSEATERTRDGMSVDVAQAADCVLSELMPVGLGGMLYPARKEISVGDQKLLERMEHLTFDITWDACRYLRDLAVVKIGARRYWALIRFATLNNLLRLQTVFLENAHRCRDICNEDRAGRTFPEAWAALEEEIRDALVLPDTAGR